MEIMADLYFNYMLNFIEFNHHGFDFDNKSFLFLSDILLDQNFNFYILYRYFDIS